MTMADQVVLMKNGRVEQDAAPAELYERPASIFVARFVGTPPMNVIPAAALGADARAMARAPAGPGVDKLAIGVRPEAVHLAEDGVAASVVAVEYLGADTLIETRIGDCPFIVRLAGRTGIKPEDTVRLAWDPGSAQWFDLASERRID
jgi:sn-glycerol 3-phosphate transport system ATP-binding protein